MPSTPPSSPPSVSAFPSRGWLRIPLFPYPQLRSCVTPGHPQCYCVTPLGSSVLYPGPPVSPISNPLGPPFLCHPQVRRVSLISNPQGPQPHFCVTPRDGLCHPRAQPPPGTPPKSHSCVTPEPKSPSRPFLCPSPAPFPCHPLCPPIPSPSLPSEPRRAAPVPPRPRRRAGCLWSLPPLWVTLGDPGWQLAPQALCQPPEPTWPLPSALMAVPAGRWDVQPRVCAAIDVLRSGRARGWGLFSRPTKLSFPPWPGSWRS